mgnify:CR=1 FL=1
MQWHIYVNGTMQTGMVEAEDRLAAVETWLAENPGEHDGLVWAQSHIAYNARTRRNVSRSPAPARQLAAKPVGGNAPSDEQEPEADRPLSAAFDEHFLNGDDEQRCMHGKTVSEACWECDNDATMPEADLIEMNGGDVRDGQDS